MVFNSLEFFLFYPAVLLLYFLVPKLWDGKKEPSRLTVEFRWIMLLAASYYFYLTWNWKLIYLIVFTTLISFFCGLAVEKTQSKPSLRFTFPFTYSTSGASTHSRKRKG